ncbi:hypothetical protein [Ectothiorhodospira marina]|uniref:O-Antigen ligase n=1 Tax=Ectothiorhodospira marina TaxID=1396821 RepID=A0A1H7RKL5_9GAMM|nr:hypothetical protein [Ectothiorhodospira marina]SEL60771.1 hypothetical protein SAMN05444515_1247 [Ectothiorhodospira marina]
MDKVLFKAQILPWLIFILSFIATSPVLAHLGWRGIYSLALTIGLLIIYILYKNGKIKLWFIATLTITLTTSSSAAMYWGDFRYVIALTFLCSSLFILQYITRQTLEKFIDIASFFILAILILSTIGFVLALSGLDPALSFPNPDGRPNYYFYTTLTNSFWGGVIRPSGIYDEPGTLSLYACSIAAIRHLTNRDKKTTWLILILGFFTLSLAHLIYVTFHFIAEKWDRKTLSYLIITFSFLFITLTATGSYSVFEERLLGRLVLTEGELAGDNRSFRMVNAYELIKSDPSVFWFGASPSCVFDYDTCKQKFPPIGENPLFPLASSGLLISWPYYLLLFLYLFSPAFGKKYFVVFGFGLLMLQRPSLMTIGISMIGLIIAWLLLCHFFNRPNHKKSNTT